MQADDEVVTCLVQGCEHRPGIDHAVSRETSRVVGLRDGRVSALVRRTMRRWWLSLPFETREIVCTELCLLPRGTGSDDGWLRIESVPIRSKSIDAVSRETSAPHPTCMDVSYLGEPRGSRFVCVKGCPLDA